MPLLSLTTNPVTTEPCKFRPVNSLFPDGTHKENDVAREETMPAAKFSTNVVSPLRVSTSNLKAMSMDGLLLRSGGTHSDESAIIDGGDVGSGGVVAIEPGWMVSIEPG
jgi:hypothetical protein